MFCQNCGSEIPDGSSFCSVCGTGQAGAAQQPMNNTMQTQDGYQQAAYQQNYQQGGYQQGGYQPGAPTGGDNYKPLAIAGMVCGIVAVALFSWTLPLLGIVIGVVGCALSGLSVKKAAGRPNGMGIAGLVCSIVALAVATPLCLCMYVCASGAASTGAALNSMF